MNISARETEGQSPSITSDPHTKVRPWAMGSDAQQLSNKLILDIFRFAIEGTKRTSKGKERARRLERIVTFLVATSYGRGQPYATFSSFQELLELLPRIARDNGRPVRASMGLPHLRAALKRLEEMNIVYRLPVPKKSMVRLWVNPDPASWVVVELVPQEEWEKRIASLRALNDKHPEFVLPGEPPPRKTLREGMVEAASLAIPNQFQSGTTGPNAGPQGEPNQFQSGTAGPNAGPQGEQNQFQSGTAGPNAGPEERITPDARAPDKGGATPKAPPAEPFAAKCARLRSAIDHHDPDAAVKEAFPQYQKPANQSHMGTDAQPGQGQGANSPQQLASTLDLDLSTRSRSRVRPQASQEALARKAYAFVEGHDEAGALAERNCAAQWEALCGTAPEYVLGRLAKALDAWKPKPGAAPTLANPLAYLARIARKDGRLH